jgi:hypothetical protein
LAAQSKKAFAGGVFWDRASSAYYSVFQKPSLCQGTTSVVPKRTGKYRALAPEGLRTIPAESFLKHTVARVKMLRQRQYGGLKH